ncbi:hydrophobic/amphiphilic exporter-1, HAE1 family [Natronincola peptidivorans]|uniref:Hydrophobic/amphiphilic exporter-1, HAE1 family n=1 Tax=Natronincola peptidivorans TaxID=426128 RepID=A0A1I0DY02_9FIRM|nr:efflux RND transporter permease subunit [Natronincola peptidivorans]SET37130.1 hydrophobic/amphiphilic exporter-1, HAE1 family [Natronincola peptidivorans]
MNLSKLAVNRPVSIVMLMLIIVLLGTVSLSRLPLDLLPEIEVPVAIVNTSYSGVGPQEMENLITRPIEGAVATVSNIESVNSISSQGSSIVIAQFDFGTDMDFVALEMREKVDMIKGMLPDGASEPMVMKIDPNATPIIQLSVTNSGDLAALQTLAEDTMKSRFERLEGVASVDISGGYTNQVQVKVNQQSLDAYGLNIGQLAQLIGASNLNLPGGTVNRGEEELAIRTMGEFRSIEEIQEMPITLPTGGIIKLQDIAEVVMEPDEINTISRANGQDSINMSIQKQSGTNTVQVANLIHREIERLQEDYPHIEITSVFDQSIFINEAIENVFKNAVFGALLAIAILYLFLRNIRTTLIIGTSIPLSVIATFILLYFNDITLNLMTLGGLALGVGMLVDNAIVVLENIYRLRTEGLSRRDAAISGASEVAMAVTASTLTTIAVFIPIVFVGGITSTIFRELALTVTLSLLASLLVSLTLIPMLSSKILRVSHAKGQRKEGKVKRFDFVYNSFDRIFTSVENRYKKILNWGLGHRKTTVLIAILVFLGSMMSVFVVGAEFFPAVDEGEVSVRVSLPAGSQLYQTNEVLLEVEELIASVEETDIVFSSITGGGMGAMMGGGANRGTVTVALTPLSERRRSSKEIADEIRMLIRDIPGAEFRVTESANMMMGLGGDPINISIKGDSLERLEEIAEDFKRLAESVDGTREINTSFSEGNPEVQVTIDKYRAATYGLTTSQIANNIRNAASGITATRYTYDGNEIDVVIKGDSQVTESIKNLEQIGVATATGGIVPLKEVADISVERGPIRINREGQQRVVTVSGQIGDRDLRSVTADIDALLKNYNLPQGYFYEFGGQNQELNDAIADLMLALVLAVALIYMVLAAQFESLLHPFTIILSVPLAFSGGLLGLFITNRSISVPAMIGVIMLAGIVVNNAIVLVDYINTLRAAGKDRREAILSAGPIRLRPILMTTLTTALGLLPLAIGIGEGAEVQAPMATVVIGGLLLSTLLTLVLIPVVYTLVDDFSIGIKNRIKGRKETTIESQ